MSNQQSYVLKSVREIEQAIDAILIEVKQKALYRQEEAESRMREGISRTGIHLYL